MAELESAGNIINTEGYPRQEVVRWGMIFAPLDDYLKTNPTSQFLDEDDLNLMRKFVGAPETVKQKWLCTEVEEDMRAQEALLRNWYLAVRGNNQKLQVETWSAYTHWMEKHDWEKWTKSGMPFQWGNSGSDEIHLPLYYEDRLVGESVLNSEGKVVRRWDYIPLADDAYLAVETQPGGDGRWTVTEERIYFTDLTELGNYDLPEEYTDENSTYMVLLPTLLPHLAFCPEQFKDAIVLRSGKWVKGNLETQAVELNVEDDAICQYKRMQRPDGAFIDLYSEDGNLFSACCGWRTDTEQCYIEAAIKIKQKVELESVADLFFKNDRGWLRYAGVFLAVKRVEPFDTTQPMSFQLMTPENDWDAVCSENDDGYTLEASIGKNKLANAHLNHNFLVYGLDFFSTTGGEEPGVDDVDGTLV